MKYSLAEMEGLLSAIEPALADVKSIHILIILVKVRIKSGQSSLFWYVVREMEYDLICRDYFSKLKRN